MATYRDKTGRWRYRSPVMLPSGERVRVSGSSPAALNTRAAAEAAERAHVERAIHEAQEAARPKVKEVPTLRDFSDEFMRGYATRNKPSERANKRCMLDKHLLPEFGHLRLNEIGVRQIDAFRGRLSSELGAKSINNVVGILRKVLAYAAVVGLIDAPPQLEPLKVPDQPFDFLDFDELDRLLSAAESEPMVAAAIILGAHAGLRRGELIALLWDHVDLKARQPQVTVRLSSWSGIIGPPKGGRPRHIPASERLAAALKAVRGLNPTVLHRPDGGPWTVEVMRFALPRVCKRAGLRPIGWHTLRHTFCSHLAMRAAPPKAIQELAGHADMSTTMRYMHLSPATLVEAIRLLDEPKTGGRATDHQSSNRNR